MSDGLNRATLLGNLGADPEFRATQSGTGVLNLRVATTSSYLDRNKERHERTDWHQVVVFGSRAEALERLLRKGERVYVEGELRTSSYEKNGEKRYRTEIHAQNIVLCGGRGGDDGGARAAEQSRQAPRDNRGGQRGRDDNRGGRGDGRSGGRDDNRGGQRGRDDRRGGRSDDRAAAPAPAAEDWGDFGDDDDIPF